MSFGELYTAYHDDYTHVPGIFSVYTHLLRKIEGRHMKIVTVVKFEVYNNKRSSLNSRGQSFGENFLQTCG